MIHQVLSGPCRILGSLPLVPDRVGLEYIRRPQLLLVGWSQDHPHFLLFFKSGIDLIGEFFGRWIIVPSLEGWIVWERVFFPSVQKEGLPFRNFHVVFPVLALLGKPLSDLREQCVWEGVCALLPCCKALHPRCTERRALQLWALWWGCPPPRWFTSAISEWSGVKTELDPNRVILEAHSL